MVQQARLASSIPEFYSKTKFPAAFLAEVDGVVPWASLCDLVEPFYPKLGNGRPPIRLEGMLPIYLLQQRFILSNSGADEASYARRNRVGSPASISAASRCLTSQRSARSATSRSVAASSEPRYHYKEGL